MIRIVHKYLYVLIAVVFASACSDLPDTSEVQHPQYISFELSEGETKITNIDITAHEFAVWVYDTKLKTKIVDGEICTLKYDEESARWRFHNGTSFFDVLWGEGGHDFFAVNSVDLAGTDETYYFDARSGMGYEETYDVDNCRFGVPAMNMTDYSGESDYNYYKDFVFAYTSRDVATEGYSPVSLIFRHLWPSLEFNIINESGQTKSIKNFSISNFKVAFDGFSFYANTFVNSNYLFYLTTHDEVNNNKYAVQDFELGPKEERSVFGVPVMVYPQKFEAYQTAELNLTVDGVEVTRTFHGDPQSGGLSTSSWEPGKLYSYDINLKAVPPKVGDFFYADGTYSTDLNTSKTVVGVVFYVGDPTEQDVTLKRDFPNYTHGLVVGFHNYDGFSGALSASADWEYSPDDYMDIHGIDGTNTLNIKRLAPAAVMTGYNNTCVLKIAQPGANAISVCNNGPVVEGASTWYMPSIAECDEMIRNLVAVNESLNRYYDYCFSNSYSEYYGKYFSLKGSCWTVSEDTYSYTNWQGTKSYAATYDFSNGGALGSIVKTDTYNIRPIFAF